MNTLRRLCYREFEQIIYNLYKPINMDELSKVLLKAGLKESEYACIDRMHKSKSTRIRNGEEKIKKDIVEFYYDQDTDERTIKYFQSHVLPNIGEASYLDLITKLTELIKNDTTIKPKLADIYVQLANIAEEATISAMNLKSTTVRERTMETLKKKESCELVAKFLAKVFIYCIQHELKNTSPLTFHNLMPQNARFTGRKEILQELSKNFQKGNYIQILSGMPGVGKTQIALQLAYKNTKKYDIIWWINAENEATIMEACNIFLQLKDVPTINNIAVRFRNYFEQCNDSWLIIYDNVQYSSSEQRQLLDAYIPKNNKTGHILMTSREQNKFHGISPKNIDVFMPDDAVDFIQQNIKTEDAIGAEELARRLGFLPLPLSYSVAYIDQTPHCNCEKYLKLLSDRGVDIFENGNDIKLDNYKWTVHETFMISINKFKKEAKNGDDFMKGVEQFIYASAYFPSYSIDLNFIKTNCTTLYPELRKILEDDLLQDKLVRILTSCSLYYIVSSSESDSVYGGPILGMHKLLQDVIVSQLPSVFPKEWDHLYDYRKPFPATIQAGIIWIEFPAIPQEIQKDPMYLLTDLIFQKCAYTHYYRPHTIPAASIIINIRFVLRNFLLGAIGEMYNEYWWLAAGKTLEELEEHLNSLDSFMLKFMYQYFYYCEIFVKTVLPSCGYLVGIKPLSEYTADVADEIVKSITLAVFSHAIPAYPNAQDYSDNRVLAKYQASIASAWNAVLDELLGSMRDISNSQDVLKQEESDILPENAIKRVLNIQKIIQMKYFEKGIGLYTIPYGKVDGVKLCFLSTSPHENPDKKFKLILFFQHLLPMETINGEEIEGGWIFR